MRKFTLMIASVMVIGLNGQALAQPAQQGTDPDGYACKLYNECGTPDAGEPATDGASSEGDGTPARTGGRVGRTRGWSIAGPANGASSTRVSAATDRKPAPGKPAGPAPRIDSKKSAYATSGANRLAASSAGTMQPVATGADLNMQFLVGSAELTGDAKARATRLANVMLQPGRLESRMRVEGHTDTSGNYDANKELSLRRAQSVVAYLVKQGVDESRFDIAGLGSDDPLPGYSPSAPQNRRVEGTIIR